MGSRGAAQHIARHRHMPDRSSRWRKPERQKAYREFGKCGLHSHSLGAAWSIVFPLNKSLWTSSFVLVLAGLDMLSLALLSFVNERISSPLEALGTNAIAIYCLNSIVNIYFPVPIDDSLQRALVILAAWLLLSFALYKKRIFIRV